jgi:hypothetical protein
MTWIIARLIGLGIPKRFAKPLLIALAAVIALAGLCLAKCSYDRRIVTAHDAAANLDAQTAGRAADAKAADQRQADSTRAATEAAQIEKVTTNAKSSDDARRAYYRCVRLQQAARAHGERSPACQ